MTPSLKNCLHTFITWLVNQLRKSEGMDMGGIRKVVMQIFVALVVILIWAAGGWLDIFNPEVLPPVLDVFKALYAVLFRPEFFPALLATLVDSVVGILIAIICAIPLGILIGMLPPVERSTRTLLDFTRSFPVVALIPIFVLIFGANSKMKIVIIAIACFFPILLQTIYGARRLEPTIVDTVRSFRIPFYLRFFRVILPAALPFISTGIRLAVSISILVAVGTELLSQIIGLGSQINLSRTYNEVDIAFAYVVYAGLLGVVFTSLWGLFEGRILSWHIKSSGQ